MLTLSKVKLPDSITVSGSDYLIKTDFRDWINFSNKLKNKEIKLYSDCDFLYQFPHQIPENKALGFNELIKFLKPERILPRNTGNNSDRIIVDYETDANLIYCAFLEQYNIDLMDEKLRLHWWKFNALFDGLHGTKLNDVMGYRSFNENDKSTEKQVLKDLQRAWEIETPLNEEEQKDLDAFNSLFEGKREKAKNKKE